MVLYFNCMECYDIVHCSCLALGKLKDYTACKQANVVAANQNDLISSWNQSERASCTSGRRTAKLSGITTTSTKGQR